MQAVPLLFVASGGLVSAVIAWGFASRKLPAPMARSDARSLHAGAIPRSGGIAIWTGWAAGVAGIGFPPWALVLPLLMVVAVSLLDDFYSLAPRIRILVHAIGAATVAIGWLGGSPLLIAFEILAIVWMANLYNFMDGADGLAASMGISGFGALAAGALSSGHPEMGWTLAVVSAACAGFLPFNLPKARLFMGDVGAVGLGFAAGAFGLRGWLDGIWPWWFAPLVFMPFVFDATFTLLDRVRRRQPIAQAHRDHRYQHAIVRSGRHGPTVARYAGWMVVSALCGLAALRWAPDTGVFLLIALTAGFAFHTRLLARGSSPTPNHAG